MQNWFDSPESIPGIYSSVSTNNDQRTYNIATLLRMYSPIMVPTYLRSRFTTPISILNESPKINIVNQICRHAVNYFGRSFPKPVFLPMGGKEERDMADVSTKFVNGLFYEKSLYKQLRNALLVGTITGTGCIKTIETDNDIYYESILPTEIFLFDEEAEINNVRSLFQIKYIDKGVLSARYPEHKWKIENQSGGISGVYNQQIKVIEAWHLPSHEDANDGKHFIVIEPNLVVLNESYEQQDFPFSFFKYIEPPIGFWGEGLGQILTPYQVKINQLLRNIEANIKLLGNAKIYVDADAGFSMDHFTNDLRGIIVPVRGGKPPTVPIQPLVSSTILDHLQYLYNQAWQASRFNPETQSGQVPTGITSRVALLTVQDMAAEQHILTGKQWEEFVLDIAKKTMDAAVRIKDRTGTIKTIFKSGKKIEEISLNDALLDPKKYKLEIQASSRTRDTVSGRLELAQYLGELGVWGKEQIVESLDVPGIWDDVDEELAESRNIDAYLLSLQKGIKKSPHPKLNLAMAKQRALKAYNRLEYEQADEEVLVLVSQWIDEVDNLQKKMLAEQQVNQPQLPPAPAQNEEELAMQGMVPEQIQPQI